MKKSIVPAILAAGVLLAGCDQRNHPPVVSAPPAIPPAKIASPPVTQPMLAAFERGDEGLALANFAEADWSARPLFESGSTLNLSQDEFREFPLAEQRARSKEFRPHLDALKKLALAAEIAGRAAITNGNPALARKYFTSVQQCAEAMDSQDRLARVQFFGRSLKKMSDEEMSKPGQEAGHEQVTIAVGGK